MAPDDFAADRWPNVPFFQLLRTMLKHRWYEHGNTLIAQSLDNIGGEEFICDYAVLQDIHLGAEAPVFFWHRARGVTVIH